MYWRDPAVGVRALGGWKGSLAAQDLDLLVPAPTSLAGRKLLRPETLKDESLSAQGEVSLGG